MASVGHGANYYFEVVQFHNNPTSPFIGVPSLQSWVFGVPVIKNKYLSKIIMEQEMEVVMSNLIPGFWKLCWAQLTLSL